MDCIRFDVYGHFTVEVIRTTDGWRIVRLSDGKRSLHPEFLVSGVGEDDLADELEVLYHELGRPDARIRRIEPT
jgi:hypothetical protein